MKPLLTAFGIAVTLAAYALSRVVASRYRSPLTTPVFFSTPIVIGALLLSGLTVEDYRPAKDVMVFLLGPATVALAIPLYDNRRTLLSNGIAAVAGLITGSLTTLVAALLLAKLFALPQIVRASIGVKSVTAPIAVELARIVHGDATLVAGFVIATGLIGAMLGPWLMDRSGIRSPLARGLALGTISHGQGTAQAVSEGELQGAAAGIAMGLAAVLTSLVAPVVVPLLL
jgi:putative effector of murein hydrolase